MIKLLPRRLIIYCIGLLSILALYTLKVANKVDTLRYHKHFTTHTPYDVEQLTATKPYHVEESSETTGDAENFEIIRAVPADNAAVNNTAYITTSNESVEHAFQTLPSETLLSQSVAIAMGTDEQDVSSNELKLNEHGLGPELDLLPNFSLEKEVDKLLKRYLSDGLNQTLIADLRRFHQRCQQDDNYREYYESPSISLPKNRKAVYLQTAYRSGSTFLGELFNQHPDAFYTFEPLHPLWSTTVDDPIILDVLRGCFQCDFLSTLDVFSNLTTYKAPNKVDGECLLQDFCFTWKTKGLCEENLLCPSSNIVDYCHGCGPVNLPKLNNLCRSHEISVVKAIRLPEISLLEKLMLERDMDIKIIQLVRDPRGIANSRYKIEKQWKKHTAQSTCRSFLKNAKLAEDGGGVEWLKGKFLRVRYEDLSIDPMTVAQEIYDFTGLSFPLTVREWIEENTHIAQTSRNVGDTYTTKRNSIETMQAWRKDLTFDQVDDVQADCLEMLEYFGYKKVSTVTELLNFNISLVL